MTTPEVVRELNAPEKRALAMRQKRLAEAQRMMASGLRDLQELVDIITGGDTSLSVDTVNLTIVRTDEVES